MPLLQSGLIDSTVYVLGMMLFFLGQLKDKKNLPQTDSADRTALAVSPSEYFRCTA